MIHRSLLASTLPLLLSLSAACSSSHAEPPASPKRADAESPPAPAPSASPYGVQADAARCCEAVMHDRDRVEMYRSAKVERSAAVAEALDRRWEILTAAKGVCDKAKAGDGAHVISQVHALTGDDFIASIEECKEAPAAR